MMSMAKFKNIQRFVTTVYEYNTRNDKDRDLPLVSLADENYQIDQAMKKDNALRAFIEDFKVKNKEAVETFEEAKELKFIKFMTPKDNKRVAGEIILVEFKGRELIRKPLFLHRFIAWLEYRNKLAVLAVAVIGAGVLGNIESILKWLF